MQALKDVGRNIALQSFEGVEIPSHLNFAERASIFATWVNEVFYASISDEILVVPNRALQKGEEAYALAFAVPSDYEGVDFGLSGSTGSTQYGSYHGGGSPIMEQIAITSQYDLESKKDIVRAIAGMAPRSKKK